VGGERHVLAALPPGRRPGIYCTGGWVVPRADLDVCGKSPSPSRGFGPRTVQSEASLYRLSYSGPQLIAVLKRQRLVFVLSSDNLFFSFVCDKDR
jgi:hypothetical protein